MPPHHSQANDKLPEIYPWSLGRPLVPVAPSSPIDHYPSSHPIWSPGLASGVPTTASGSLLARLGVTGGEANSDAVSPKAPGRHPKTLTAYNERAVGLFKRCIAERVGQPTTFLDFVRWLIAHKLGLKSNTWGLYRVAILSWFDGKIDRMVKVDARTASGPHAGKALQDFLCARDLLFAESREGCCSNSNRTSSRKAKRLPERDRIRIEKRAMSTASPNASTLCDLLRAAVRTGLRPTEWWGTAVDYDVETDTFVMTVPNEGERGQGSRADPNACFQRPARTGSTSHRRLAGSCPA